MIPLNNYQKQIRYFWLYALKLEKGKYYVGLSSRKLGVRLREHGGSLGAAWTKKFRPIEVIEVQDLGRLPRFVAEKFEHELFEDYVRNYNLRNVRGGKVTTTKPIFKIWKYYIPVSALEGIVVTIGALLCLIYLFHHSN